MRKPLRLDRFSSNLDHILLVGLGIEFWTEKWGYVISVTLMYICVCIRVPTVVWEKNHLRISITDHVRFVVWPKTNPYAKFQLNRTRFRGGAKRSKFGFLERSKKSKGGTTWNWKNRKNSVDARLLENAWNVEIFWNPENFFFRKSTFRDLAASGFAWKSHNSSTGKSYIWN